jgi:hypothetical protein
VGASLSATGTNDFDTLFTLYSYNFTAEATTTTLTFTDTSSVTDDVDGLVAQVSADTAPTGEVPEPSSFALLGVGLSGMGVRRVVRYETSRPVPVWRIVRDRRTLIHVALQFDRT